MKRNILLTVFTLVAFSGFAQIGIQASYNLWLPTGKYNSDLKAGLLGAQVELKYFANDYINVTAGVGYNLLSNKTVRINRVERPAEGYSDNATVQFIPVTIGAEVFFNTDKLRPYLDMDFGVALVTESGDNLPEKDMAINAFISPGIGIAYSLSDALTFNGVVKSNVVVYNYDGRPSYRETFTAVGINLGLSFKF